MQLRSTGVQPDRIWANEREIQRCVYTLFTRIHIHPGHLWRLQVRRHVLALPHTDTRQTCIKGLLFRPDSFGRIRTRHQKILNTMRDIDRSLLAFGEMPVTECSLSLLEGLCQILGIVSSDYIRLERSAQQHPFFFFVAFFFLGAAGFSSGAGAASGAA